MSSRVFSEGPLEPYAAIPDYSSRSVPRLSDHRVLPRRIHQTPTLSATTSRVFFFAGDRQCRIGTREGDRAGRRAVYQGGCRPGGREAIARVRSRDAVVGLVRPAQSALTPPVSSLRDDLHAIVRAGIRGASASHAVIRALGNQGVRAAL